jgi:hypothetical protein
MNNYAHPGITGVHHTKLSLIYYFQFPPLPPLHDMYNRTLESDNLANQTKEIKVVLFLFSQKQNGFIVVTNYKNFLCSLKTILTTYKTFKQGSKSHYPNT